MRARPKKRTKNEPQQQQKNELLHQHYHRDDFDLTEKIINK